jgi:hypothetical protein
MPEPVQTAVASVSLMTLAVAVFGPQAGPYIVIVLGSIAGGLWALSSTTLQTRMEGAWLMLRCVVTAVVLTALIAGVVGPWIHVPVSEAYAVVAFVIGMLGNKWQDIIESIKLRLQAFISNAGGPK